MWFSSAILRASGDTFIFRISAVLRRTIVFFFGWLQWDSFFSFFVYLKKRRSAVVVP
jgi:hypothetical protein